MEGLFEEHIDIGRERFKETKEKGRFWKKYGKPAAIVGIPVIGIATYFALAAGKGKETKITGEELKEAVNLPKQTEVYSPSEKTETSYPAVKDDEGIGYRYVPQWDMTIKITPEIEKAAAEVDKYRKEGKSMHAPPRDVMLAVYALHDIPWDWNPKELSIETARNIMIRDYGLPEDSKILVIRKNREEMRGEREYFKRMGYDLEMVYHIIYDNGALGGSWSVFYAGGEWGGMPYFKQKWEESKR